jgi:hypothetical protein
MKALLWNGFPVLLMDVVLMELPVSLADELLKEFLVVGAFVVPMELPVSLVDDFLKEFVVVGAFVVPMELPFSLVDEFLKEFLIVTVNVELREIHTFWLGKFFLPREHLVFYRSCHHKPYHTFPLIYFVSQQENFFVG